MDNLFGGPASSAMAAICTCAFLATSASSEVVPLGVEAHSGHMVPEALSVEDAADNEAILRTQPQGSHVMFTSEHTPSGAQAHLRSIRMKDPLQEGPMGFQLSIDLEYTSTVKFQEAVEFGQLTDTPGLLRLGLETFESYAASTLQIHNLANGEQRTYQLDSDGQQVLELVLDPGTYRLILEGTLDPGTTEGQDQQYHRIPAPAALWLLGPALAPIRRRRR